MEKIKLPNAATMFKIFAEDEKRRKQEDFRKSAQNWCLK
jgi:hypothetical protein